jgi:hypothetical protein
VDNATSSHASEIAHQRREADVVLATANKRIAELRANTPNPDDYEVVRFNRVGGHVVMQVRYPSCAKCAFEGLKTMVFLNVDEAKIMRWRRIDPHFRNEIKTTLLDVTGKNAPSPTARFPGNDTGWADAIEYAERKRAGTIR